MKGIVLIENLFDPHFVISNVDLLELSSRTIGEITAS
jgi:hypothetical protein